MAHIPLFDIFRIKDLSSRIFFTLSALLIFRLGTVLPIPGVNGTALKLFFDQQQSLGFSLTDYLDFFSGGAFRNFSIFMLGIMPYISMSIIMQLMVVVFPSLKKIQEEDGGKNKIHRWVRYGTIIVCLIQAFAITNLAKTIPNSISVPYWSFVLITLLTVTTGTVFLMWLGEQINQRGIGNGISLLIFTGILADIPNAVYQLLQAVQRGELNPIFIVLVLFLFVVIIALVILEQQGQRKIPVHYAKRIVGRKMYGAQNTYIPLKLNPSGVIPVIFASSVLLFPLQIAGNLGVTIPWLNVVATFLRPNDWPYIVIYTLLIVFFAYFYTQVSLNPVEISKQIREQGGSIPGVRSERLEGYLTKILNRITLPGSLFLALIAIIPSIILIFIPGFPQALAYVMGGTSLLILVGVDLDTMLQIEGHLRMHHHEGFSKKRMIRSRNL